MQKIIVANWKMNKTIEEAQQYTVELAPAVKQSKELVYLATPFTALWHVAKQAQEMPLTIGAQNIDFHPEGAFTGETSATMIQDAGATFVILGHSERRRLFHETSEIVNLKIKAALSKNLQVILCIGETQEERKSNQVEKRLNEQILKSLEGISEKQMESVILAYEPIWAIGTGSIASLQDISSTHKLCRDLIAQRWNFTIASRLPILYGGSVKVDNARELLETPEVDGLLVGGASLSVDSFSRIILSTALNYS